MNLKLTSDGRSKASSLPGRRLRHQAFTLMEVMIAIGVFAIGVFAILDVVASTMHGARLLQKPMVDAGCVAGEVALTNSLVEVDEFGDLSDLLGDQYKGYAYTYSIVEVQSNRLFQVHLTLHNDAPGKPIISQMDILLFRPASPPGTLDGGMTGR
jgi:prepilin-type N-terminal cleavage/methylation domain-containing protein